MRRLSHQTRPPLDAIASRGVGLTGLFTSRAHPIAERRRSGFTLIDVMVSLAVIAVLLAILAPSLTMVRETARKVRCSSNIRQVGIGIVMYADANKSQLPYSVFAAKVANDPQHLPQAMITLRRNNFRQWDGIGLLYSLDYLPTSGVFYCPSHTGQHTFARYADAWNSGAGSISGNIHYRGDVNVSPGLTEFAVSPRTALLADGLAARSDFNHITGLNVLRSDISVQWYPDTGSTIYKSLPEEPLSTNAGPDRNVQEAWNLLDAP